MDTLVRLGSLAVNVLTNKEVQQLSGMVSKGMSRRMNVPPGEMPSQMQQGMVPPFRPLPGMHNRPMPGIRNPLWGGPGYGFQQFYGQNQGNGAAKQAPTALHSLPPQIQSAWKHLTPENAQRLLAWYNVAKTLTGGDGGGTKRM